LLSRYVAQVFSERFWDGSSCLYYYWYHFCFLHSICDVLLLEGLYILDLFASFLITFLVPEIAVSINIHVPFSFTRIMMCGLLLDIVLSVYSCWFHNMVTVPSWLVSTNFDTCSLSNFTPLSMHMLKWNRAHTLSCLVMYCSFANIGHADIMCSTVSSNCWHLQFLFVIFRCMIFCL
jgi:hypothetical protein